MAITMQEFTLCLPQGWEEVSGDLMKARDVPEETVAAFRMSEPRGSQRDNIVISRESLTGNATNLAYGETNIRTIAATPRYELLDKHDITVDGDDAVIHVFASKPMAEIPVRRFYQLSLTKNTTGYTFTGTLPYSVAREIEQEMIGILQSVSLATPVPASE